MPNDKILSGLVEAMLADDATPEVVAELGDMAEEEDLAAELGDDPGAKDEDPSPPIKACQDRVQEAIWARAREGLKKRNL